MISARADAIFHSDLAKVRLATDRMFFWLLLGQWLFAIAIALMFLVLEWTRPETLII